VPWLSYGPAAKAARPDRRGGSRCVAAAIGAELAATRGAPATAADDPTSSDLYLIVVGSDDGLTDLSEQLRDVLSNPPLPPDRRIQIERTDRFRAGDLFSLARPDANHPSAWVVVENPVVHIRAAGAGRTQFVFRDLTVSEPMTELDRERVGQTLRTVITALIEGSAGSMGRGAAQCAVGFEEPQPPVAAPPPSAVAPGPALPTSPSAEANTRALELHLGASLQVARIASQFAYAPGAIGSVQWRHVAFRWRHLAFRPSVWGSVMGFTVTAYAASLRAGVGATVLPLTWLHVDLGGGFDWLRSSAFTGAKTSVYRLGLRFGPTDRLRIRSSVTLSIEHVNTIFNYFDSSGQPLAGTDGYSQWRPGLTLELWWI